MNKTRIVLIIFVILTGILPIRALSQNQVTIKDPDITFSYTLPEKFANHDDDYYHYIYPEDANGSTETALQLTYFQGYSGQVSDFKDGVLNGKLANTLENFELQDSGSNIVDGTVALWSKYTFTKNKVKKCGKLICFARIDQYFEIQIESSCTDFSKYEGDFEKIIRSLTVKKNL